MSRISIKYPNWWREVQVGDVLKAPSGRLRVVRAVSGSLTNPNKRWVQFIIQHCSWTHACVTTYNMGELMRLGYRWTGAALPLRTKFDKEIAQEIARRMASEYRREDKKFDCCDVKGMS